MKWKVLRVILAAILGPIGIDMVRIQGSGLKQFFVGSVGCVLMFFAYDLLPRRKP